MDSPMTVTEIRQELARWTFMPGWSFMLISSAPAVINGNQLRGRDLMVLRVTMRVRDSRQPDQTIDVETHSPVPYGMTREFFPDWFRHVVHSLMAHEADEWLRRDGALLFDPHTKDET